MNKGSSESRSREKLKEFVKAEITKLFSSVLDYAEIAIDGKERYSNFRSKVLKVSNDAIREVSKEVDVRYSVSYIPPAEEIINFKQTK